MEERRHDDRRRTPDRRHALQSDLQDLSDRVEELMAIINRLETQIERNKTDLQIQFERIARIGATLDILTGGTDRVRFKP